MEKESLYEQITINAELLLTLNSKQDWVNRIPRHLPPKIRYKENFLWIDKNGDSFLNGADFEAAEKTNSYPCRVYRVKIVSDNLTGNVVIKPKETLELKLSVIDLICKEHPSRGVEKGWSQYTGGMKDSGEWFFRKMLDEPLEELREFYLQLSFIEKSRFGPDGETFEEFTLRKEAELWDKLQ